MLPGAGRRGASLPGAHARRAHPYVWLDATFVKARQDGRVASQAVLVAIGVTAGGERHVLGVEASPGEDRESWMRFLRSMVGRELSGVRLVTSE